MPVSLALARQLSVRKSMMPVKFLAGLLSAISTGLIWSDREYLSGLSWLVFVGMLGGSVWLISKEAKKREIVFSNFRFFALSLIIPAFVMIVLPNAAYSGRHMGNIYGIYVWIGLAGVSTLTFLVFLALQIKNPKANKARDQITGAGGATD